MFIQWIPKLALLLVAFSCGGRAMAQAAAPLHPRAYPVQAVMTTPVTAKLRIYPEGAAIKKTFADTSEVQLISPEHVLASMASATSYAWDVFHAQDSQIRRKGAGHYNKIASLPLGFPLFALHYVLEIEGSDGQAYAFARIGLLGVADTPPLAGYFFRKIDGLWKLETSPRGIEENYGLVVIKPQVLYQLVTGDLSEADADLLALKAAVVDDNGLNLALLGRLIWTWFQDDELHAARITKYCDNPNWNN